MVELWERQPRERDPAYYCKQIYIKEIKTDRTLQKVIDFIKTLQMVLHIFVFDDILILYEVIR